MLTVDNTILAVVDIQGKLAALIHQRDALYANVATLIGAAEALDLAILRTEQAPDKLGPTVREVAECLDRPPITKTAFSCCGEPAFNDALRAAGRRQVLLTGIETHICIFQTAADLVADGFEVHVVADAVSSRTAENRQIGLDRARAAGATITSVECALFELLRTAEHPAFRQIARLIR
ncbi:MAG: hydrolase [Phycisphaerae bacterium]|nr:hydrolase [Phycisphaerae bacterium]